MTARVTLVVLLVTLVGACNPERATEILVSVDTDLTVPAGLEGLTLQVSHPAPDGERLIVNQTWDLDPTRLNALALPGTFGLLGGKALATPVLITVTGEVGSKKVVERKARLPFVPGRIIFLRMNLLRSCLYRVCAVGKTCGERGCEAIDLDPASLPNHGGRDRHDGGVSSGADAGADAPIPDSATPVADVAIGGPDASPTVDTGAAPLDAAPRPDSPPSADAAPPIADRGVAPDVAPRPDAFVWRDAGPTAIWKSVRSPVSTRLNSVWAASRTDVWAVGDGGRLVHYNGTRWLEFVKPQTESLEAVWGTSGSNVWALGDRGAVVHYDGWRWRAVIGQREHVTDVWGSGASDIWAVADGGRLLHYDGKVWIKTSNSVKNMSALWGTAKSDIWVVGTGGSAYRQLGAGWFVTTNAFDNKSAMKSVWGDSPARYWAVGSGGRISAFDGTKWSVVTPLTSKPLNAVHGRGSVIFAVGDGGTLLRSSGKAWTLLPTTPTTSNLRDVWVVGHKDAWAVGDSGVILHFAP